MRIHAVEGDIADEAPKLAEAAVLWLRSGFNGRCVAWQLKLLPRYGGRLKSLDAVTNIAEPWMTQADRFLKLVPPDGKLKCLYVFANPTDGFGFDNVAELKLCLNRCLRMLVQNLGVRTLALIHMPLAARQHGPAGPQDEESGRAMIRALRDWDQENPDLLDDVYLVDLQNGFAPLIA